MKDVVTDTGPGAPTRAEREETWQGCPPTAGPTSQDHLRALARDYEATPCFASEVGPLASTKVEADRVDARGAPADDGLKLVRAGLLEGRWVAMGLLTGPRLSFHGPFHTKPTLGRSGGLAVLNRC